MSHWKAACPKCGSTVGISHVKPLADMTFTTCGCRLLAFWEEEIEEEPESIEQVNQEKHERIRVERDRYKAIVDLYISKLGGPDHAGNLFDVTFPSGMTKHFPTYEAVIEALEKML